MNNKDNIQETEILLDEMLDAPSDIEVELKQEQPDNIVEDSIDTELGVEHEEITEEEITEPQENIKASVIIDTETENGKSDKPEDIKKNFKEKRPHPPIKPGHEPELTHLLREAGRFLHPGPKDKISQKEILMAIKNEKEITQKLLAEKLHKSPAAVSEIVRKLVAAKMIKRVPNQQDRRAFDLELTEKGIEIAQEFEKERPAKEEDMYSILTEEEKENLTSILKKLINYWRETKELPKPPIPPKGPKGPGHKPGKPPVPPEFAHGPIGMPPAPHAPHHELEREFPIPPEPPVEPDFSDTPEELTPQIDLLEPLAEEDLEQVEMSVPEDTESVTPEILMNDQEPSNEEE